MLKEFFQRRCLRKGASPVPTGLLPLRKVRAAAVLVDVEDPTFNQCKETALSFFRDHGIKADIFYMDFRRLSKEERLITSITTTVLRKDLNWYGRPSNEKMSLMLSGNPDLFISLVSAPSYAQEYMAGCSRARFKVGRYDAPAFDLVFRSDSLSQLEAFLGIVKLLDKVE